MQQGESHRSYTLDSLAGDPEVSCLRCHLRVGWNPGADGNISCRRCRIVIAIEVNGQGQIPPFDPPRSLPCKCCLEMLPTFCFYQGSKIPSREGRFSTCRQCCSEQARARSITNPGPKLQRDLQYSQRIQAERVAGERPPVRGSLTEDQREKQREANRRYKARLKGRAIPLLRVGRKPLYFTPACRAIACPLRHF